MLPLALNGCPKCKKSPNLVTLDAINIDKSKRKPGYESTELLRHPVVQMFGLERGDDGEEKSRMDIEMKIVGHLLRTKLIYYRTWLRPVGPDMAL